MQKSKYLELLLFMQIMTISIMVIRMTPTTGPMIAPSGIELSSEELISVVFLFSCEKNYI